jgi:hypothetical protein
MPASVAKYIVRFMKNLLLECFEIDQNNKIAECTSSKNIYFRFNREPSTFKNLRVEVTHRREEQRICQFVEMKQNMPYCTVILL